MTIEEPHVFINLIGFCEFLDKVDTSLTRCYDQIISWAHVKPHFATIFYQKLCLIPIECSSMLCLTLLSLSLDNLSEDNIISFSRLPIYLYQLLCYIFNKEKYQNYLLLIHLLQPFCFHVKFSSLHPLLICIIHPILSWFLYTNLHIIYIDYYRLLIHYFILPSFLPSSLSLFLSCILNSFISSLHS